MHRIYLAFLVFFRVLFGRPLPAELLPPAPEPPQLPPARPEKTAKAELKTEAKAEPKPEVKAPKPDLTAGALQLLALFQREGRLVDFLSEAIDGYEDAAIGAAVRDIHRGCKKALDEHISVEPVLTGDENEDVTVDAAFDPRRIRLTGNVVGQPPYKGILKHHGWRAAKVKLPTLGDGLDATIVAPAEVELP